MDGLSRGSSSSTPTNKSQKGEGAQLELQEKLSLMESSDSEPIPLHSAEARLLELLRIATGKMHFAGRKHSIKIDDQTVPLLEQLKVLIGEYPKVLGRIPKNTPTYLLSRLENEKLSPLNHAFVQQINGIDKHLFIEIVESAIEVESGDRLDVVFGLDELFEDIDINGDGKMEWSEFTQYIIDAVEDVNGSQPGSLRL